MSGFFDANSKSGRVKVVFYGTDYHTYPCTKRAGMIFIVPGKAM